MDDDIRVSERGPGGSLESLLALPGVLAGMVATEEGLPVAARLRSELDEEALAAAAAVLGRLGPKALGGIGYDETDLVMLDASKFRFMVRPLAVGYLMVVTDPSAEPDPVAAEMSTAATDLDRAAAGLGRRDAA